MQEADSNFGLELFKLPARGGFGHAESARGAGETSGLDQPHEQFKLFELYCCHLCNGILQK